MNIQCSVSLGELVDKITILEIKSLKITDTAKLGNINQELKVLTNTLKELRLNDINSFKQDLYEINTKLWNIEDDIREKELAREFDERFIQLARDVYITNDERFRIKNSINIKFNSSIKEEKSYKG